jgi:DNA-binding Lrp family transcriptional regulator
VPTERLDAVAAAVNRFAEVNHNYEREHRFNLWFVVTAASEGRLQATLGAIEQAAGYPLMPLPLLEEFHIDLGFPLQGESPRTRATAHKVQPVSPIDEAERRLVSVLQEGLPLFMRPFALIAERIGASENEVLARIGKWLEDGAIKRFGIVVRHRELGYTANAMVVHDIPDERVGDLGRALAEEPAVTLCYRRPRLLPDWPYNLFCMIHGRERTEVEGIITTLRERHGIADHAHDVLFSLTRFKQNGARYA